MTLDEAIKHCKEKEREQALNGCFACAEEHRQLAEWLEDYKRLLEEPKQDRFECRIKIKDLISMLLEFDMNEKATIHTTDEYKENNIIISITDTRGEEE